MRSSLLDLIRSGRKVEREDFGTSSVTIPNASAAAVVTVTHNLGDIPKNIQVTGRTSAAGAYAGNSFIVDQVTAVDFRVYAFNVNAYTGGIVVNFDWRAIALATRRRCRRHT